MKRICLLPRVFDTKDKEATHITTFLLSFELGKKHDITILTGQRPKDTKQYNHKHFRIRRVPNKNSQRNNFNQIYNQFFLIPLLLRKHRKTHEPFDVLIGMGGHSTIVLRTLLARFFNKGGKTVHVIKSRSATKELPFLWRLLLNRVDAVVVQNHRWKKQLESKGVKNVRLIRSPTNLDFFSPKDDQEALKKKHGFKNKKVILYYGHFNQFKGVEYLIKSLKHLKTKDWILVLVPNWKAVIHTYDELIEKEKMRNKVRVFPPDIPIDEFVNLADVAVFAYPELISTETNPLCVVECMHAKTPVVSSDLPEIRELIDDYETGFLAQPKDPESIAKSIDKVFNNPKDKQKIIEKAHKKSKRFDYKKIAKEYDELFEELLKQ